MTTADLRALLDEADAACEHLRAWTLARYPADEDRTLPRTDAESRERMLEKALRARERMYRDAELTKQRAVLLGEWKE